MDIIRQCAEQPNVRVRALLRLRALNDHQINHFLVLACARLIRTYIMHRHGKGTVRTGEPDINTLLHGMKIPTLATRVKLETAFTTQVVRELAPGVIAQLYSALGADPSLLTLLDKPNAA